MLIKKFEEMGRETIALDEFLNDAKEVGLLKKNSNISDDRVIINFFYDIPDTSIPDEFPYEFVDDVTQRGDGEGYETFYVFLRKSDNKTFYYYIYDGRIEEHELSACGKKKNGQWDFECKY